MLKSKATEKRYSSKVCFKVTWPNSGRWGILTLATSESFAIKKAKRSFPGLFKGTKDRDIRAKFISF